MGLGLMNVKDGPLLSSSSCLSLFFSSMFSMRYVSVVAFDRSWRENAETHLVEEDIYRGAVASSSPLLDWGLLYKVCVWALWATFFIAVHEGH